MRDYRFGILNYRKLSILKKVSNAVTAADIEFFVTRDFPLLILTKLLYTKY